MVCPDRPPDKTGRKRHHLPGRISCLPDRSQPPRPTSVLARPETTHGVPRPPRAVTFVIATAVEPRCRGPVGHREHLARHSMAFSRQQALRSGSRRSGTVSRTAICYINCRARLCTLHANRNVCRTRESLSDLAAGRASQPRGGSGSYRAGFADSSHEGKPGGERKRVGRITPCRFFSTCWGTGVRWAGREARPVRRTVPAAGTEPEHGHGGGPAPGERVPDREQLEAGRMPTRRWPRPPGIPWPRWSAGPRPDGFP